MKPSQYEVAVGERSHVVHDDDEVCNAIAIDVAFDVHTAAAIDHEVDLTRRTRESVARYTAREGEGRTRCAVGIDRREVDLVALRMGEVLDLADGGPTGRIIVRGEDEPVRTQATAHQVKARSTVDSVVASATVKRVRKGTAGDLVVQLVAGARRSPAGEGEVLDIVANRQRIGRKAGLDGICTRPHTRGFADDIVGIIDNVGVIP